MARLRLFRLGVIAAAMLLVWALVLLIFRPPALDTDALRATMTRKLTAWSGGQLAIAGPLHFSYFPTIAVEAEGVTVSAPERLPLVSEIAIEKLRIEGGLLSLLWPNADFEKLILEGARVSVRKPGPTPELAPPQTDEMRLLQAMKDTPVEWLILRRSRVQFEGEEKDSLEQVDADIRLINGSGAANASGKLQWHGQPVTFALNGSAPQIDKGTASIPMTVSIEAPALNASLDGRAAVASGMQFAGQIELSISDVVRFGRWMGLLLPEGGEARKFSFSGKFDWDKDLIGFDEGSFSIDGNRAIGALAMKFGAARPQVEGTLAFQKLMLPAVQAEPGKAETPVPGNPDSFTWMHHVDIDLRISTASLVMPSLEIGQAAISAVLRSGQLDADFAILDLCEGKANGRLEYDAAVPEGRARLAASINGLSARTCLAALAGAEPLRGTADIDAEITTEGRDFAALLQKASGQVRLNLTEGEVDLDIAKLGALAAKGDLHGWAPLRGRTTAVNALEGTIVLRPGTAYSDSIKLITADKSVVTGEGTVDLATGEVDYRIVVTTDPPKTPPAVARAGETGPSQLHVSGSLSKPVFQIAPVRSGSRLSRETSRYAVYAD